MLARSKIFKVLPSYRTSYRTVVLQNRWNRSTGEHRIFPSTCRPEIPLSSLPQLPRTVCVVVVVVVVVIVVVVVVVVVVVIVVAVYSIRDN